MKIEDLTKDELKLLRAVLYSRYIAGAVYKVTRRFIKTQYIYVCGSSEDEAKEKAIDINDWQDEDNDSILNFEYTIDKKYENYQR